MSKFRDVLMKKIFDKFITLQQDVSILHKCAAVCIRVMYISYKFVQKFHIFRLFVDRKMITSFILDRTIDLVTSYFSSDDAVGLNIGKTNDEILEADFEDLNGGHLQRMKLAKSMYDIITTNPQIVIFDEPNNHIDRTFPEIFAKIMKVIKSENRIVFVTDHKYDHKATHNAIIENGKITIVRK